MELHAVFIKLVKEDLFQSNCSSISSSSMSLSSSSSWSWSWSS